MLICTTDCEFTWWRQWSRCSKRCGKGVRSRRRSIRKKEVGGGKPCFGKMKMKQYCNKRKCPTATTTEKFLDIGKSI